MILSLLISIATAAETFETQSYFRVRIDGHTQDAILLTSTKFADTHGYFLSYSVDRRVAKKIAIDKRMHDALIAEFRQTFNPRRQAHMMSQTPLCPHPLILSEGHDAKSAVERDLCLDLATAQENAALTKWWRKIRSILRL